MCPVAQPTPGNGEICEACPPLCSWERQKDLASLGTDRTKMKDLRLGLGIEVCQNAELELGLTKSLIQQLLLSMQLDAQIPKLVSAFALLSRENISRDVKEI